MVLEVAVRPGLLSAMPSYIRTVGDYAVDDMVSRSRSHAHNFAQRHLNLLRLERYATDDTTYRESQC